MEKPAEPDIVANAFGHSLLTCRTFRPTRQVWSVRQPRDFAVVLEGKNVTAP